MARRNRTAVDQAINSAAMHYGLDPAFMRNVAKIESGFNPNNTTGSYKGLFQLSDKEFQRGGGTGNIYDPTANAMAAGAIIKTHQASFEKRYGREPTGPELYMIHQQGWGGFNAHMANPDAPAWRNMASTAEGRARGEDWARRAITDNTLPQYRKAYGGEITSRQFMDMWASRFEQPAAAPGASVQTASADDVMSNSESRVGQFARSQVQPEGDRTGQFARPQISPNPPRDPSSLRTPMIDASAPADVKTVADSTPNPIVQGIQSVFGENARIGSLFGQRPVRVGGGSDVKIPQFSDPGAELAQYDQGSSWPSIQARRARQAPRAG